MSTIDVRKSHSLPKDDAKQKAEMLAKSMEEKFSIQWQWAGDTIRFDAPSGAAKGTKGEVGVTENEVRVQIDLPFMLKVMKGTIESKVVAKLNELL